MPFFHVFFINLHSAMIARAQNSKFQIAALCENMSTGVLSSISELGSHLWCSKIIHFFKDKMLGGLDIIIWRECKKLQLTQNY